MFSFPGFKKRDLSTKTLPLPNAASQETGQRHCLKKRALPLDFSGCFRAVGGRSSYRNAPKSSLRSFSGVVGDLLVLKTERQSPFQDPSSSGIELLVFMYSLRRMHGRTKKTPEANGYKQNPICKHIGRSKHIRWKYKSSPAKRFWLYNANCTIIYDHHISPKIWKKEFQSCSSYGKKQPLGAVEELFLSSCIICSQRN